MIAVIIAGVVSFAGEVALFRSRGANGGRMRLLSGGCGAVAGAAGGRAGAVRLSRCLVAAAIVLVAWLLSLVIRFALSRSRRISRPMPARSKLTKRPDAMISALFEISGRAEMAQDAVEQHGNVHREPALRFHCALLATHPPIEDRVAALEPHAGGRRPATGQADPAPQRRRSCWRKRKRHRSKAAKQKGSRRTLLSRVGVTHPLPAHDSAALLFFLRHAHTLGLRRMMAAAMPPQRHGAANSRPGARTEARYLAKTHLRVTIFDSQ